MDERTAIGLAAAAWLAGALVVMARSVRRGQTLADLLARREPDVYEALGRPRPGWLDGPRRRRFARFVGTRAYESLGDPGLVKRFESHRRAEARALLWILGLGALLAVIGLVATR